MKTEYTSGPKYWGPIAVGPQPKLLLQPGPGDPHRSMPLRLTESYAR